MNKNYVLDQNTTETDTIINNSGGLVSIQATGVFDGADLTIMFSQNGADFITLDDFNILSDDVRITNNIIRGASFKIKVNNHTSTTSINVYIAVE